MFSFFILPIQATVNTYQCTFQAISKPADFNIVLGPYDTYQPIPDTTRFDFLFHPGDDDRDEHRYSGGPYEVRMQYYGSKDNCRYKFVVAYEGQIVSPNDPERNRDKNDYHCLWSREHDFHIDNLTGDGLEGFDVNWSINEFAPHRYHRGTLRCTHAGRV